MFGVPVAEGGLWTDVADSARTICQALRTLAQGDSSVALVSAMHPAVLSYWVTTPSVEQDDDAWQRQKQWIYQTVRDGDWWGTITSEPGSGGDVARTRATARPDEAGGYRLSGQKHFGSGSGVLRYMVTTARVESEEHPDWFFLDMKDQPWDGSTGVKLVAEWDAHGMTATQSHGMAFENFPAQRIAWPGQLTTIAARAGGHVASETHHRYTVTAATPEMDKVGSNSATKDWGLRY